MDSGTDGRCGYVRVYVSLVMIVMIINLVKKEPVGEHSKKLN